MYLTIEYDNLKITCQCEIYGDIIEVEEFTCPDYDYEIADFIADRYEKDQQFAMVIQDELHTAYVEEQIARAAEKHEDDQFWTAHHAAREAV